MASMDSNSNEPSSLPPLGDELDFLSLIWAVDHALQRASKRMNATLGLTGPQRLVVRIIGKFPSIPAGQLARLLHLHPSTLTGVLKRLERRGLIDRRLDPRDARRSLLGLTSKGRQFDIDREGTVEAAIHGALPGFSAEKLRATREVLELIAGALEHTGRQSHAPDLRGPSTA